MAKIAKSFRFENGDLKMWQAAANDVGLTLSEWMRRRCNFGMTSGQLAKDLIDYEVKAFDYIDSDPALQELMEKQSRGKKP